MSDVKILWVDDEVELLRSQIVFLENRGFSIDTVTNGFDAIDKIKETAGYDLVFLDESMPGITGLETLEEIKKVNKALKVVMITKNEAEDIMEQAIGSQIADYLIKPVNPNQILLTIKKLIDGKRLVHQKTSSAYQQEFNKLLSEINQAQDYDEWYAVYRQIINWELRLDASEVKEMSDILAHQKNEANLGFCKYVDRNYEDWIQDEEGPLLSHRLFEQKVFPNLEKDKPTILLLLDNFRLDQYEVIKPILSTFFDLKEEGYLFSILPTATQYARNATFAGMLPSEIKKRRPNYWIDENDEGSKNKYEAELLEDQIKRVYRKPLKVEYIKVTNIETANRLKEKADNFLENDLTVIVYNFIDMMSHVRTHMEVLKELASDEKAYRSLTKSWFENSPIWDALKVLKNKSYRLMLTTDHGTIRVNKPVKVIGDRETSTNIRYKVGKRLKYPEKDVIEMREPEKNGLPSLNLSSRFIFAKHGDFFLYPNNYNHFNKYYDNTFQHGGVSMEEMIIPFSIFDHEV